MKKCRWKIGHLVAVDVQSIDPRVGFSPTQVKSLTFGNDWDSSRHQRLREDEALCLVVGHVWNGWPVALTCKKIAVLEPQRTTAIVKL